MKKTVAFLSMLICALLALCPLAACSDNGTESSAPQTVKEKYSEGLEFSINSDLNTYTVSAGQKLKDKSVVIPGEYLGQKVVAIADNAFDGCAFIEEVSVPESVKSIGDFAFSDCVKLTGIKLPSSVKSVGDSAFSGCTALKIAYLEGVETIGEDAFFGCVKLASVILSQGLERIGDMAFSRCGALKKVFYLGDEQDVDGIEAEEDFNEELFDAVWLYYLSYSPEAGDEASLYWHYGANGEPEIWSSSIGDVIF